MRKILITGGAGMIGSNLAKEFVKSGDQVIIVDNLWRGKIENLTEDTQPVIDLETQFHHLDLTIPDVLDVLLSEVDYIVHLADIVAGIGFVFGNQGYIFRQNLLINSNVYESVRNSGKHLKGVMYVGTACSFPLDLQNSFEATPLEESQLFPANPESAYGWSKLMGQYELDLLGKELGINTLSLIFHNVYGAPCDFGERSQVIPALINKVIENKGEDLVVWGSGKQGRAFIHVNDIVDAICLALEKGWGHSPLQIGPSICTSVKEIAENIIKISQKEISIQFDLSKPEGDLGRSANYEKAKRILGWEPKVSIHEGLTELYTWIVDQKRTHT